MCQHRYHEDFVRHEVLNSRSHVANRRSRLQGDLHRRDPRLSQGRADATAEPDVRFFDGVDLLANPFGRLPSQQVIDLADMTDWILSGGGFHRHRAAKRDQPIDAIAAADLAPVSALGGCTEHREIHSIQAVAFAIQRIDLHMDAVEVMQLRLQEFGERLPDSRFAMEVRFFLPEEMVDERDGHCHFELSSAAHGHDFHVFAGLREILFEFG